MKLRTLKLPGGDYALCVGAVRIGILHFTSGIKNSSPWKIEVKLLNDEVFVYKTMSEALLELNRMLKGSPPPGAKSIPVWIDRASEETPMKTSEAASNEKAHSG
jgi:hypothetical protein